MRLLVLFDIDGTLIHTAGAGKAAVETALVEVFGTAGAIRDLPFDGMTDGAIVRTLLGAAGLPDPDIDRGLPDLWPRYEILLDRELERRRDRIRVADGVFPLLDRLEGAGAAVGLLTGNIAGGAGRKLRACGLADRFAFGAFGSDSEHRDDLPAIAVARACEATGTRFEPDRTWVVGDTPRDVQCARAGGLRSLAVATGRYSVADLDGCGPDHVVGSLDDTEGVLGVLHGSAVPSARIRALP